MCPYLKNATKRDLPHKSLSHAPHWPSQWPQSTPRQNSTASHRAAFHNSLQQALQVPRAPKRSPKSPKKVPSHNRRYKCCGKTNIEGLVYRDPQIPCRQKPQRNPQNDSTNSPSGQSPQRVHKEPPKRSPKSPTKVPSQRRRCKYCEGTMSDNLADRKIPRYLMRVFSPKDPQRAPKKVPKEPQKGPLTKKALQGLLRDKE